MSVRHEICWVQRAGGTRLFPAPVRWTERGVVVVGSAAPERATWRRPHGADGLRRDGLPNGRAQGGSIWARAAKGTGRTDRGPATGHDAAHRTPRRLTGHRDHRWLAGWLWATFRSKTPKKFCMVPVTSNL
jgi:hypothetical protein